VQFESAFQVSAGISGDGDALGLCQPVAERWLLLRLICKVTHMAKCPTGSDLYLGLEGHIHAWDNGTPLWDVTRATQKSLLGASDTRCLHFGV
jgi:hypothetical protein